MFDRLQNLMQWVRVAHYTQTRMSIPNWKLNKKQRMQLQGTKDIKCVCGISAGQGMVMVANLVETAIHMLRNIAMGKPSTL
jgi:hypothetical protein